MENTSSNSMGSSNSNMMPMGVTSRNTSGNQMAVYNEKDSKEPSTANDPVPTENENGEAGKVEKDEVDHEPVGFQFPSFYSDLS